MKTLWKRLQVIGKSASAAAYSVLQNTLAAQRPHAQKFIANFRAQRAWQALGATAALVLIVSISNVDSTSTEVASAEVKQGKFIVSLKMKGELRAKKSYTLTVPRSNASGIQIVTLLPEGSMVKAGEVVVQLDTTQAALLLEERQGAVKKAAADLESRKASFAATLLQLENAQQSEQYSYEQAKLSYEQMQYEAGVKRRQQGLRLQQAELARKQAEDKIAAQKRIQQAGFKEAELQLQSAQLQLEQAQNTLAALTMKAPGAGLVIYRETRSASGAAKIKIGDMVWYGQDLIEISDLSAMQIKTRVNEVDAGQVANGQQVIIKLEALPEANFYGEVSQVATLATRRRNSDLKDFDVMILLRDNDPRLKPGMTASIEIITDRMEQAIYVPAEAVFEKEGKTVVYFAGSNDPIEVTLGLQNGNSVVVASGLKPGAQICLRDPSVPLDVIGADAPKGAKK